MVNMKLEELSLLDKFLFDETMEDKEAYQAVINILLENEVEILGKPETEKEFRVSPELWQVRLDFMEYIGKTTDDMAKRAARERINQIHKRVRKIRKSEKAGLKYMQRWEELAYAREEGEVRRLVTQICKKMKKNKTLEEIAEDVEEEISVIEPIYNTAKKFAPEYDPEQVFKQINGSNCCREQNMSDISV